MSERLVVVVAQPPERVHRALCEQTCDLVPYIDGIERAEIRSREATADGCICAVHAWEARADVPRVLAPHLDSGLLRWIARAEWRDGECTSRWVVEPLFLKSSALCDARIDCVAAMGGRGSRVVIDFDVKGIHESSGLLTITKAILSTHFRKLVEAAGQLATERAP